MKEESLIIKRFLYSSGADLVGFADLTEILPELRQNMRYGISIIKTINPVIANSLHDGPNIEYYNEYKRLNNMLDELALKIVDKITNMGYNAIAKTTTEVSINKDNRSTDLPHKTVATRAGVGWIGKCALLITKEYGSAIRLTTVLTNLKLDVGKPINQSRCGECNKCQIACSAKAIKGVNWNSKLDRDKFYNSHACRKEARMKSELKGINESLCGLCIFACPYTRNYLDSNGLV